MEGYDTSTFKSDLQQLSICLTDKQIGQFMKYYEMLVEWNGYMNLTAITEFEDVMKKHFIDSLSLVRACELTGDLSVIDVGTGAGFPGLALKIAFPGLDVMLLDSLNKRVKFLDEVIRTLDLEGVHTVHGRAEDYAKPGALREKYDLCVSRAVANMTTLSEYCLPFVKVGGSFVSYKSERLVEELETAGKAIHLLGGQLESQKEFTLPDSDIYRNLVVIRKIAPSPSRFPRKAGLAAKEPLV